MEPVVSLKRSTLILYSLCYLPRIKYRRGVWSRWERIKKATDIRKKWQQVKCRESIERIEFIFHLEHKVLHGIGISMPNTQKKAKANNDKIASVSVTDVSCMANCSDLNLYTSSVKRPLNLCRIFGQETHPNQRFISVITFSKSELIMNMFIFGDQTSILLAEINYLITAEDSTTYIVAPHL